MAVKILIKCKTIYTINSDELMRKMFKMAEKLLWKKLNENNK